jgi:hypothetical protein
MVVFMFVVRPRAVNQFGRILIVGIIAALVISRLPIFKEGLNNLSDRFTSVSEGGDTTLLRGLLSRIAEGFTEPFGILNKIPAAGYGLGLGTNAGAHFLVGMSVFLLSENEWSRILYESGPFLGMAFLLWRTMLTFYIGYLGLTALKRGNTLPLLLFSCAFIPLLSGQLGQPTTLGFAVVLSGLCLASMQESKEPSPTLPANELPLPTLVPKPLPRRSAYASRLHDPNA